MPLIDTDFHSNLQHPISGSDESFILASGQEDVCETLDQPSHIFATIYTAARSEVVILYKCEDGKVVAQRGAKGTTALSWPTGACLCVDKIVEGEICELEAEDDYCDCPNPWEQVTVGKGLELDLTDPLAPIIRLADTGVQPQQMCGAEINACGQFTYVPPNWPATCLPVFEPCCDGGGTGGGGATDAEDVSYSPRFGAPYIQNTNVAGALEDLEDAIQSITDSGSVPVTDVIGGNCISVSGTATEPVVGITPTGIAPGNYNGFDINSCGLVTGYNPPVDGVLDIQGTDPIRVLYSGVDEAYTVSILQANTSRYGAVRIADGGDMAAEPTGATSQDDFVVTWEGLKAWALAKGI